MTHEAVYFTLNQFISFNNHCPIAKKKKKTYDNIEHNNIYSIRLVEELTI